MLKDYEPSINLVDNGKIVEVPTREPNVVDFLSDTEKDLILENRCQVLGKGLGSFLAQEIPHKTTFHTRNPEFFPPEIELIEETHHYLLLGINPETKNTSKGLLVFKRVILGSEGEVVLTRQEELQDWIWTLKMEDSEEKKKCIYKINGNGAPSLSYGKWIINGRGKYTLDGGITITSGSENVYLTQDIPPEIEEKIYEINKRSKTENF